MKWWFDSYCLSLMNGWNNEQIRSRQLFFSETSKKVKVSFFIVWHLFLTLFCILVSSGIISLAGADSVMDLSGVPTAGSGALSPSIDDIKAGGFERGPSQESYLITEKQSSIQSIYPYGSISFVTSWGRSGSGQAQFKIRLVLHLIRMMIYT